MTISIIVSLLTIFVAASVIGLAVTGRRWKQSAAQIQRLSSRFGGITYLSRWGKTGLELNQSDSPLWITASLRAQHISVSFDWPDPDSFDLHMRQYTAAEGDQQNSGLCDHDAVNQRFVAYGTSAPLAIWFDEQVATHLAALTDIVTEACPRASWWHGITPGDVTLDCYFGRVVLGVSAPLNNDAVWDHLLDTGIALARQANLMITADEETRIISKPLARPAPAAHSVDLVSS